MKSTQLWIWLLRAWERKLGGWLKWLQQWLQHGQRQQQQQQQQQKKKKEGEGGLLLPHLRFYPRPCPLGLP